MKEKMQSDFLFEVSWEVCNKVGGIFTVVATKALNMSKRMKNGHILIGPDVWRDTEQNPDFTEDPRLLRSWKAKAAEEGLRVRVGHWNVAGSPIAILVDFTAFIAKKDEIFAKFWEVYKLDSISGQWDYIESALFGYVAGKVIESFTNFNTSPRQRIVAQFHEWMTGAGLLYLKMQAPYIGCIFTTHATVVGRCIAGNNLPLYDKMEEYNADEIARQYNVVSQHSLEKAAAHAADCFTTVSDITARECKHFLDREIDIVTPNGFENSFTPPADKYSAKRTAAREKLLEVAQALLNRSLPSDTLLIGTCGRYEYKNKGLDVFIDALAQINRSPQLQRNIVAFIMVPGNHHGPNKELLYNLQHSDDNRNVGEIYSTHYLSNPEHDPVLLHCKEKNLNNSPNDKVQIIFAPSYLNGNDGVFNMPYYDLLIGLDQTLFPSYYEPWGYTPLESLAFGIPTLTTSLAGFGEWVNTQYAGQHESIDVILRNDGNYDEVVAGVADKVKQAAQLSEEARQAVSENAKAVSAIALWDNQIQYYKQAAALALEKVLQRLPDIPSQVEEQTSYIEKKVSISRPSWSAVMIHRQIPAKLSALEELSKNLWWCWNEEAIELFRSIDPELWESCEHNPIAMLDKIRYQHYQELEKDAEFVGRLRAVHDLFTDYMKGKKNMKNPAIAYFSMEYGLHTSLKIYSGGLGILAGDYLKEASDKGTHITAVGLLYRYGYFTQKFSSAGDQVSSYEAQDFMKIPAVPVHDNDGKWVTVSIAFPGRNVNARLWRVDVGRVELYLLDTDFEDNLPEDRSITYHLYGGDWENRLKQEILLGVGGIRALRELQIDTDVYHCNEGHAAFIGLERLREFVVDENLTFGEALEVVRGSSLFTTHTPVPAGHDAFNEDMLRTYMSHYPTRLKISWAKMMSLGKINAGDPNEKFSMSYLAANLSQEVNGVSWLHGEVSRDILKDLWPGYLPEELHVSYVTNGVHYPTWTAAEWKEIQGEVFGDDFKTHHYDKICFDGIYKVGNERILAVRNKLRKRLINEIKRRLSDSTMMAYFTPRQVVAVKEQLRDDVLTIGFARRFATYKRAHLLFKDLDRLSEVINNPKRPVQFVFAGKAHPADKAGQDLIKRIIEVSKMPQFIGKIVFVPNYDIELAKLLVQGVDIWLNTPMRPLEASGTSGEKAVMNGVMHFSVLDGWWVEGYQPGAGWALPMEQIYENQAYQDELDVETIYNMIDDEIAPMFYKRDKQGIAAEWMSQIKNTIAKVASNFTTNRMLIDYEERFYNKLAERHAYLIKDNYAEATAITEWKKKVEREWEHIEMLSFEQSDNARDLFALGKEVEAKIILLIGELDPNDVGVEFVIAEQEKNETYRIKSKSEFILVSHVNGQATYKVKIVPDIPGMFYFAARIFAKNPKLPHRQDFALVKWL
ncbi:MAG: alpha-glucan family phosphorylase [Bacteroidales bacterium]|nr:alpha-glucan family phosphorylase [Bacteroidales bacterium]MCL2133184.1 alpha-glucan family phosphorylase [Bacteroidales bacterium]